MKKDLENLCILFITSILLRFLSLASYYIDKNYQFINGIPYYVRYDSWYYARILENMGFSKLSLFIIPCILLLFSLYFIYKSIRIMGISPNYALYGSLIISFYPSFFFQSLIGNVDTNFIIFFSISGIIYTLLKLYQKKSSFLIYIFDIFFFFFLLIMLWGGWKYIVFIFIIGLLPHLVLKYKAYLNKKISIYIGVILLLIIFIFSISLFKSLFFIIKLKNMGVGEYLSNTFLGYYLLVVLIIYLIYKYGGNKFYKRFFLMTILFTTLSSLIIQRFSSIGIIFLVIYFSYLMYIYSLEKPKDARFIMLTLILLFGFFSFKLAPTNAIILNDDIVEIISQIDDPVLNFWEYGHIINYFSNYSYTQAQPSNKSNYFLEYILLPEEEGINYLDKIYPHYSYYIFLDSNHLQHYEWLFIHNNYPEKIFYETYENSIYNKTINNLTMNNFIIVNSAKKNNKTFYLLKRKNK